MATLRKYLLRNSTLSVLFPSVWKLLIVIHTAEFFETFIVGLVRSPRLASFLVSHTFSNTCLVAGCLAGIVFEFRKSEHGSAPAPASNDTLARVEGAKPSLTSDLVGLCELLNRATSITIHEETRTADQTVVRTIEVSRDPRDE